ncbi:RNA-binding protein [Breoghania sp. L-A4]|uniref:RNA-binding protein n=1 Tax=Breoghania sp. L-A4 TaxID=2304600 RepID=UPI000E35B30B|nr:RNA-binding protein [Breoghania sp. L-A4]AXS39006.1 RNA-binding protein [Breoghania sp. L-A4]
MTKRGESGERQCAVTRETRPVDELIRFVLAPDGSVVPDLKRVLPGRGVWVTATRTAVETAERKKVFGRAFKADAHVAPGLADRIEGLLEKAALGNLGLIRKAGQMVVGFAKVEAALKRGEAGVLIHASDASDDGIRKLAALSAARFGRASGPPVIRSLSSSQLSLALGRANVIHAALLAGRTSESFMARERVLAGFRADSAAATRNGADKAAAQDLKAE